MNKYINEILKYSHRDKLSYNYLMLKTGIKTKYIPKKFIFTIFKSKFISFSKINFK